MLLVADASVLVSALADFGPVGDAVRSRLTELTDEELHILRSFTDLEILSAIRTLVRRDVLTAEVASSAIRSLPQLPVVRHELTQPI